jgi:hypothetical protein
MLLGVSVGGTARINLNYLRVSSALPESKAEREGGVDLDDDKEHPL